MNQLPAHLQRFQAPDVGAALSQNLGSAMPPHVSIEGGRFTLVDASNNEIPVPTFDPKIGVYLDAAIIDVNEHMSRMYYAKPYDPSAAGTPPDCWSDNGVAASIGASAVPILQAPHPRAGQSAATCAECPMAVWGSKVSAQGKAIPACSQKQKTALLVPGFSTLFLLSVPPNSHSYMREYVERSRGSDVNLADVITRISFVTGVQGTLQFAPVNYIDEPTAILRQAAYTEKKTDALVGRNDVPRTAASVQQVQQPAPFVPPNNVGVAQFPVGSQMPMAGPVAVPQQPAGGQQPEPPATPRRRRRTAAEMQAAQSGQQAPAAAQTTPQAPFPVSQAPGALPGQLDAFPTASGAPAQSQFGIAAGQPAGANPEVSAMLDDFFKGQ